MTPPQWRGCRQGWWASPRLGDRADGARPSGRGADLLLASRYVARTLVRTKSYGVFGDANLRMLDEDPNEYLHPAPNNPTK